jgi:hypothetical protein
LAVVATALFALSASAGAATAKAANNGADSAVSPAKAKEMETQLLSALTALKGHVTGAAGLTDEQIAAHTKTVKQDAEAFGSNDAIITAALDLVTTFEDKMGPLWVAHPAFSTKPAEPKGINWAVFQVMQNIMDKVYTEKNVARYARLLDGFKFKCSANFPGSVEPPADPTKAYTVKINASYLKPFKHSVQHEERPARRPTGAYLAPGLIATVTVPKSLVGKGCLVRVCAQSWDNSNKPRLPRLYRVSLVYPINDTHVKVASPLGGGIYIEAPLGADAGVVEVTIKNAVRSPFFSATPYHKTSLAEWRDTERNYKAPWADFQSEKFLMQVPTSWIYKLDDPVTLMKNWDMALDAVTDLMGLPNLWGREVAYSQVDLQNRGSAFFPGYPTCNDRYDPTKDYGGYANSYLVRGPQYAPDYMFHEMGHGLQFVKFAGERESTVNLPHVAVWNEKFGYGLDEAFRASRSMNGNKFRTLDNTAVTWMTSLNFAAGKPMTDVEKAYQLKGHAKYVDIARLFGWKVLGDYWHTWIADEEEGKSVSRDGTDIDVISLRLSKSAGADLTPLLHFWGTPPRDAKSLKSAVAGAKLPASAKVYDTLVHYKSLVPKDNKAFRDFATKWWGKQPSPTGFTTERNHAEQWEKYDEKTAAAITTAVQEIIGLYFPNGRPGK